MPNIIDSVVVYGSYVLVMRARWPISEVVGRLGVLRFDPGWYLYFGSAFGRGGIVARLCRHLRRHKVRRWHVDNLTEMAELDSIWLLPRRKIECHWVEYILSVRPHMGRAARGFGSSDCGCAGHLLYSPVRPERADFPGNHS